MSAIKMLGYNVQEVSFKLNTDVAQTPGMKNFQISPKIRMDMRVKEKNVLMMCTVTVDKHQPTPTPFEMNVVIAGSFLITEDGADSEQIRIEASNGLFPYVRSTVSQLTTATNMPSYFLPIIDFATIKPNAEGQNNGDAPSGNSTKRDSNIVIRPLEEL